MIEKTNRINALFDFYEPLLTKKQMEYISLYYRDDFSLGEIAENYAVSRQAVYDNIKRTEKILEEYENKLHLYQAFIQRGQQIEALETYFAKNYPEDQKIQDMLNELEYEE
ncbi:putative DNA-binding protein [Ligilactobacillus ceti]|uniref:UPF0122 protein IV53_GL000573 n=1 Tax=Ligilactobacillus ceti DSM 22408 TaxID=1122146 RepID=A0A0R2KGT6_9LACO|nr:putative DNA-binding protein [Ligilactobacillus ceti]KRN88608.1 Signal recognition particle associated protein [Ligilactobacillus ceti DSM 22408]